MNEENEKKMMDREGHRRSERGDKMRRASSARRPLALRRRFAPASLRNQSQRFAGLTSRLVMHRQRTRAAACRSTAYHNMALKLRF